MSGSPGPGPASSPTAPLPPTEPLHPTVPPPPWARPTPWIGARFWRRAAGGGRAARPEVLAGLLAVGLLTGLTLPAPNGTQWPVLIAGATAVVLRSARRPVRLGDRVLVAVVVGLGAVGALRASAAVFALCLLVALGLAALLAVGARDGLGVVVTPVVVLASLVRGLPWAARGAGLLRRPTRGTAWVRGTVIAVVVVWICGALLSSADGAFAGLLSSLVPDLELATLPVRVVLGGLASALTLALAFSAAVPPRWAALRLQPRPGAVAEWLLPVVALDVLLTVFLAVQAAVLFGAYPAELVVGDATPAERARAGFGQLVLTTLVAALLLAWAARRSDPASPRHRRALTLGGGGLLVLVLVVVASALRRLWLYEQAFGWTVLRLNVGVFEVWLGLVLVGSGALWLARRTVLLPRLVVGSAAAGVLALGLAGPDALVAGWNVDRFERTGKLDLQYVARLSDDAVPALGRLPEAQRRCVLGGREISDAPWYAANLGRIRAQAVLDSLGRPAAPAPGMCEDGVPPSRP